MVNVKIFGAGSIGNHLAHACRNKGWNVTIADIDPAALERTRTEIFPSRYGAWDPEIRLMNVRDVIANDADVVFIGTPPDAHIPLALEVIERSPPKVLLIEKPLCGPNLSNCRVLLEASRKNGLFVGVGYNHLLGKNTLLAEKLYRQSDFGEISTISTRSREHWGGIFQAHPWLSGPEDTYLGFLDRGGGALGEHSHALNLWQHFAHFIGAGRVQVVQSCLDIVKADVAEYDRLAILSLKTEGGLVGDVIQDVVTFPAVKSARVQGEKSFLEWHINYRPNTDAVIFGQYGKSPDVHLIPKTRADDFKCEIDHVADLVEDPNTDSPISLRRGLDTMMVIAAAVQSHERGCAVNIDWSLGYELSALN